MSKINVNGSVIYVHIYVYIVHSITAIHIEPSRESHDMTTYMVGLLLEAVHE